MIQSQSSTFAAKQTHSINILSDAVIGEITSQIVPISETWHTHARLYLDTLTKPLGSLGQLEDLAAQLVAILKDRTDRSVSKAVYIFAADHGITEEGVSAYPREVTRQMVLNFIAGGAAISVLARLHDVSINIVDVGVDTDFVDVPGLFMRKVSKGTANTLHHAAMTDEQLANCLKVGSEMAVHAASMGHTFIGIGEMGIGNTTSASILTCALTQASANSATGMGTGISPERRAHKVSVVEQVLQKHTCPAPSTLELLRRVGGLEIAAMTGAILAAARHKLVIVVDGFISTAAAALAVAINADVRGYLIAGHRSEERGHQILLNHLQLAPVLSLNMRLGEATGAVLAMPILESALNLYTHMATFASANVSESAR